MPIWRFGIRKASYTYGADDLHDNTGYNPFEGTTLKGMPRHMLSPGELSVRDRALVTETPRGRWLPMRGGLRGALAALLPF